MEKTQNIKSLTKIILAFLLLGNHLTTLYAQSNTELPEELITEYVGVLAANGSSTRVNTEGICIIKTKGYRTYAFYFSDGVPSISGIKFIKNDDTYTSTVLYRGKTLAITVDEEGDLAIGSSGIGTVSFSGSIKNTRWEDDDPSDNSVTETTGSTTISLGTGNTSIHIDENQTNIGTENAGIHTSDGNIAIGTGNNGILIENGNISLGTGNTGISVNSGGVSTSGNNTVPYDLINCNSPEISNLPNETVGIYRGKLKTDHTENRKGICTIVKTACKTYRLDFSNGIPSIHDIQFGRKNDFDEYTSVIIEGEYSSAIEVDMTFNDLEIDGEVLHISFDGKKN